MDFNKIKEMGLEYAEKGKNAALDLAEKGRTQAKIVNAQSKLYKAQRQLGALVYSLAKGNEENQPLVDKYIEMIANIEQELSDLKASLEPDTVIETTFEDTEEAAADVTADAAAEPAEEKPAAPAAKPAAPKAEDRPGVTRTKQWVPVDKTLELLDTPGILWPKFEDSSVGVRLAFTGAIRDEVVDIEELAMRLMDYLGKNYPKAIEERYKLTVSEEDDGYALLEKAGRKRGFLISGGEVDTERMSRILLDEFRGGKLGRFTLEFPPEGECT